MPYLGNILAIYEYSPRLNVVESEQQPDYCALPTARMTNLWNGYIHCNILQENYSYYTL